MEKLISVVIPSKDEEKTIAKCIDSVIAALEGIQSYEIILVDSYSVDRTIEIAKKYPIRILRLKKYWPKSPAAGRYLGGIDSNGKYILYLDADMAVDKEWIKRGLNALEKSEKFAGVTGVIYNVLPDEKVNKKRPVRTHIGHVEYLPGAAIYRNDALKEVKYFNPFLQGYEDKEIGYRISERGFKQLRIKDTIAYHFVKEKDLKETQEKSRYFTGVGQFLRLHFNLTSLVGTFREYPLIFFFYCYFLFSLGLAILSIIQKDSVFLVIPISLSLVILLALIFKQRNLRKSALFILSIFLSSANIVWGLLRKTVKADEYPKDLEIIK